MPRTLAPRQISRIFTLDVDSGQRVLVHESDQVLYEAPNWSLDGDWLYVNGDGHLFRVRVDGSAEPERIDLGDLPALNNDHVLDPDGEHVYVSCEDSHIYRVPLAGGAARRITPQDGRLHFLHGVSPDGMTISYIRVAVGEDARWTPPNVHLLEVDSGVDTQLTDDEYPDDGAEFAPDGTWIYLNSERAGTAPGHAQLFRMRPDGTGAQQLTHDERVNWFPHVSPDGTRLAYVSFPPGTEGHPADRDVIVRICAADGSGVRDVARVRGGQGTMNVPSWSPDGRRIALVEYPLQDPADGPREATLKHAQADLAVRIREALADEPVTAEKRMFGTVGFMVAGALAVCARQDGGLLVHADPDHASDLLARSGARVAEMGAGRSMGPSWIEVAADAVATEEGLRFWIAAALAGNRAARERGR